MGVLRYEFYSKLLGKQIRLCMVLPEQAHAGKLPDATLYLLHGGGGNAEDWLRYTSVERYADERQMAVIMPERIRSSMVAPVPTWWMMMVSQPLAFQ